MAAKKGTKKRKATLVSVLLTVERGFAAVADDITDIKSKMAAKDDIAGLDTRVEKLDAKIDSVESNLAGKINRLDTKLTKFEEREIDKRLQLEVRVSAIEKHLGLSKKIAA
jgi:capsule polysaccharide export protein KpsE/RkpR